MSDCYWHGYSGSPGACHACEIADAQGEEFRIDTVTRCECGSGVAADYCGSNSRYSEEHNANMKRIKEGNREA